MGSSERCAIRFGLGLGLGLGDVCREVKREWCSANVDPASIIAAVERDGWVERGVPFIDLDSIEGHPEHGPVERKEELPEIEVNATADDVPCDCKVLHRVGPGRPL